MKQNKPSGWREFLETMGWDEPEYGWTKEKQAVKKLISQELHNLLEREYKYSRNKIVRMWLKGKDIVGPDKSRTLKKDLLAKNDKT